MNECKHKIEPFEYLGGRDFTSRLVEALGLERFNQLHDVLGVNKGTISTWHTRGMTPFELAVRVHLSEGIPLKWLLLGEGELNHDNEQVNKPSSLKTNNHFNIDCFDISKGSLVPLRKFSFDKAILNEMGVSNVMAVKTNNSIYLVDKENRQAINGKYLIDMDGVLSINELLRLPGKKLAMNFNGSTINIEEDDIKVVGRVAMVMGKE